MLGVVMATALAATVADAEPEIIQLTHNESDAYPWPIGISDDGRRVAWITSPEPPTYEWKVYVGNEDGTDVRQIAAIARYSDDYNACGGISMSGDGRKIAFATADDPLGTNPRHDCRIFLMDATGANLQQITGGQNGIIWDRQPRLNRDGSVMTYIGMGIVGPVVKARQLPAGEPITIDQPRESYGSDEDLSIDAAGDRIVFQVLNIFWIEARGVRTNGSESHEVYPTGVWAPIPGIQISRDGSTVLYATSTPDPGNPNSFSIQMFATPWEGWTHGRKQLTDPQRVREVAGSTQPMIADGSRAAFWMAASDRSECAVAWVDTRTRASEAIFPWSPATCDDYPPMVSADGRVLFFMSSRLTPENPDKRSQMFVLRYARPPSGGSPPLAAAGPDQVLECEGNRRATATLDGSGSTDPDSTEGTNDDIASYLWSERGATIAATPTASVSLALGAHDLTLSVQDRAGASSDDAVRIDVRDTVAPSGVVVGPPAGACFGPGAIPVFVTDDFGDVCDPTLEKLYEPAPGPAYSQHGDVAVTLTARDVSGNTGTGSVRFTIDLVAPHVVISSPAPDPGTSPGRLSAVLSFTSDDDDGASGGVVHEVIKLANCPIFDGLTYGDGDGLLSDETIQLGPGEACRIWRDCGFGTLSNAELRFEATDCGGNLGSASVRIPGRLTIRPSACDLSAAPIRPMGSLSKPSRPNR